MLLTFTDILYKYLFLFYFWHKSATEISKNGNNTWLQIPYLEQKSMQFQFQERNYQHLKHQTGGLIIRLGAVNRVVQRGCRSDAGMACQEGYLIFLNGQEGVWKALFCAVPLQTGSFQYESDQLQPAQYSISHLTHRLNGVPPHSSTSQVLSQ